MSTVSMHLLAACIQACHVQVWHNLHMQAGGDFTLVGSGRIATALQEMGPGNDVSAWTHACCIRAEHSAHAVYALLQTIIRRGEEISTSEGPIVVCTRNDDLQAVLDATPEDRHEGVATAASPAQRSCCCLSMSHTTCLTMQDTPRVHEQTQ